MQLAENIDVVYKFLIVLCRIGTFCMFLPPIGELSVNARFRLAVAVMLSLLCTLTLGNTLNIAHKPLPLFLIILQEIGIGITYGLVLRMFFAVLHVAGNVTSMQAGLSIAMMFDPAQSSQNNVIGTLLSMTFLTLLVVTDTHLILIKKMFESYHYIELGTFFENFSKFNEMIIKVAAHAFNIGIIFSTPIIAISLILNISGAVLSRLMPQMQTFFVLIPVQILVSIFITWMVLSSSLMWLLQDFSEYMMSYFYW